MRGRGAMAVDAAIRAPAPPRRRRCRKRRQRASDALGARFAASCCCPLGPRSVDEPGRGRNAPRANTPRTNRP
eukprot:11206849-Lingulodinium_polyedra.AAC.1